jgi:hypothetical protein
MKMSICESTISTAESAYWLKAEWAVEKAPKPKALVETKSEVHSGKIFQKKMISMYDRVLCIGTRITLDNTLKGLLPDFRLYNEGDVDLTKAPRVIVQYESLHKMAGCKPFDLVIIDEVESVGNNITANINGKSLKDNATVFEALLKTAKHVLLCDADISQKSLEMACAILGEEQVTLCVNTSKSLHRNMLLYDNEEEWMAMLKRFLQEGKRVVIPVASKRKGRSCSRNHLTRRRCPVSVLPQRLR